MCFLAINLSLGLSFIIVVTFRDETATFEWWSQSQT